MLLFLTWMAFFGEIRVFLQPSRTGFFGANRTYHHTENYVLQEVFLSKTNSIFQGNNVLDVPASNKDEYLWRYSCIFSTQLHRPIWNKMSLFTP
jgi:hypothetical protein